MFYLLKYIIAPFSIIIVYKHLKTYTDKREFSFCIYQNRLIMKSNLLKRIFFIGICSSVLFGFYSCSEEDDYISKEGDMGQVEFSIDSKKLVDTRVEVTQDYTACNPYNEGLYVTINLKKMDKDKTDWDTADDHPAITKPLKLYGGVLKAEPHELDATKKYRVELVSVHNQSKTQYYHSSVAHGSTYAVFIPEGKHNSEQVFTVKPYTKENQELFVLCARGENANSFGMPKFGLHRINVTCFDLFINVCDENQEHVVGEGTLNLYEGKRNPDGTITKSNDTPIYSDEFGSGDLATLCFPDDLTIPNKADYTQSTELFYVEAVFTNYTPESIGATQGFGVTLEQLLLYKDATNINWDSSMNAVHLWLCGTPFSCIVPGTCTPEIECKDFVCIDFNDFPICDYPTKLYTDYGWQQITASPAVPATEYIKPRVANANDHYLEVTDEKCKDKSMMWRSPLFNYKNGDVFSIDMWIKEIVSTRTFAGLDKVDVTISASDEDGGIISTLAPKTTTVTIDEFLDNSWKTLTFTPNWTSGCIRIVLSITPVGSTYWSWDCCCLRPVWGDYDGGITVRMDNICFKRAQ